MGPRGEAGPCSQDTRPRLRGWRGKKTHYNYHLDPEKMRRLISHNNLLWYRWSRDCRIAARPASAAPAAEEMGPEGMAGDSVAPAASSPRRRGDLRSPALSDWTSGAAAP